MVFFSHQVGRLGLEETPYQENDGLFPHEWQLASCGFRNCRGVSSFDEPSLPGRLSGNQWRERPLKMEFVASFLSGELRCNGFFHPLSASRALSGAWGEDARGVGTIPRQHQAEVRAAWARMGVCECVRGCSPHPLGPRLHGAGAMFPFTASRTVWLPLLCSVSQAS